MKLITKALFAIAALAAATSGFSDGRGSGPVVFVTGQGLFYDSIVISNNLPIHGPFQKLEMDGPTGLQTEFGPGDQGYVGGRWWVDLNGNNEMDSTDGYFSCPLLGPGRVNP
ncbi:MAG TPA: hypothetical protein VNI20_11090 [Fimbriimonadaceae bacterium]|nr:hypothetical protein [Fimbriimonadaceae bacterium]